MKKVSGLFHIVDFKTEKIIAVLQPKDYYDDLRHWELKSNIDTLTFKVLIDNPNADALIQQNLVLRQTRDGRFIPYVIEEAIQTKDGRFIEIFSSAVWVEIAQSGVPPAFRKKTTLRKSELKNQKIYHYSKTHTVSFFIQKIIQHNINCVVLGVIININLGV
ncbi:hypothetical protein [Bacillus cereus]|uniref:hypothetical protein n=1 Tax=Bacillus cereus TaxID=1396 RepID=UPI003D655052